MQADNTAVDSTMTQLQDLQASLGYTQEALTHYAHFGINEVATNAFLLRFLLDQSTSPHPAQAAAASLSARRSFEHSLPSLSISPGVVAALRSGAFAILGRDKSQGRVVLYFNLNHFSIPSLEVDESQRLLILLMEYMQFLVVGEAPSASSSNQGGSAYTQQFVLVINEENADWSSQQNLLSKSNTIHTILSKYYPRLVGQVIIVGAGFGTREGIQSAINSFPSSLKEKFVFIQRSTLCQYVPSSVIPTELGGTMRTSTDGMNFAEMALRHWYTLTAFLLEETSSAAGASSVARPLYLLPPRRSILSFPSKMKRAFFSPPSSAENSLTHFPQTDDGLCSLATDVEESDQRTELLLQQDDVRTDMEHNPRELLKAYRLECAMRKAAEQRLQVARQQVHVDPIHASAIEKNLIGIHRDVHTMTADVLQRMTAASSRGEDPPTLMQLLDATIAGLDAACGTAAPPPAVEAAAPPQREEKESGCCCCCC